MSSEANNIYIEDFYSYSYTPLPRYGDGKPGHPQIERVLAQGLTRYDQLLGRMSEFCGELLQIGLHHDPAHPERPNWINGFLPGLDVITIYGMTALYRPRMFLEIGSGNSTKIAVAAKRAHRLETTIISIDPAPRAEVNDICDTVIRKPLQECDMQMFADLEPGDFLFLDGDLPGYFRTRLI